MRSNLQRSTCLDAPKRSTDPTPSTLYLIPRAVFDRYLLGRCHLAARNYNSSHTAYQQAVYRDEKSPILWCSIGILYFKIGQYKEVSGPILWWID